MHGPSSQAYYTLEESTTSDRDIKKRRASIPQAWQKVTGKRCDGLPRQPIVRRNPPDAGAPRDLPELHDAYQQIADKYWKKEYDTEKRSRVEGRWITPYLMALHASGYAMLCARCPAPGNSALLHVGTLPSPHGDPLALVTADVWRAYARVRTCRASTPHLPFVTWDIRDDGIYLSADDLEGNTSTEWIPTGTSVPRLHCVRFRLNDAYIWPLHGRTWFLRVEHAPAPIDNFRLAYAGVPVLWEHETGLTAVTMPANRE